jgi:phosphodiesterase/alkaline phosphatase D-like protein
LTDDRASSATILGSEQWQWLQSLPALDAKEHVALAIVVSSIQVVNSHSFDSETWGLYPEERERLLTLLRGWPCAVVVVSGDRHYSEFALQCRQPPPPSPCCITLQVPHAT